MPRFTSPADIDSMYRTIDLLVEDDTLQKVHIDFSRAINMMCNLSHFL